MNAKFFLDKTLRLLFNPEASEEAMKEGKPAPAATGNEPQFTPGVMARMFPRPIISPEYTKDAITFRMKAENAQKVMLKTDFADNPIEMQRDSDGVWSITLNDHALDTFEYYFIVDGMNVADPNNMYLSPAKGFKPSYTNSPFAPYSFAAMGNIEHGVVSYNLNRQTAMYRSPAQGRPQASIQLVPAEGMTVESWFKVGGADAVIDKLTAEGKCKPVMVFSGDNPRRERPGNREMNVKVLKADDFKTWQERRNALVNLLNSL